MELAPATADRDALQRLRQRGQALLDRAMPAAALRRWRTDHAACALGFSGKHPRALDGLARLLSLDMRVIDLACIGFPLREMGILPAPKARKAEAREAIAPMAGAPCPECSNSTLVHKDGCDFCIACGHVGVCG